MTTETCGTQSAAERCRTGCAFMADSRVVPCATCPSRDALTAAQRRVWRGVPAVHATVYRDDDGNEILGSRGEWMLLAVESVCGPFRTLTEAKQYVEDNDV